MDAKPEVVNEPSAPQGNQRAFVVTHRLILSIAVPMTLAYLTTPLLGLTDTAVVGQFGDPALLGGLAAGAIIFDLVFASFNFLRSGTTGLVAQAYGRGDARAEQAWFWRAYAVSLVSGGLLLAAAPLIAFLGAWFIDGEAAVTEALRTYVLIRLLSAPMALANYAILGYVLGRGEGMRGLFLQIVLNGCNIALSVWFGLGLGWGIEGVAWGTVCGEAVAFLVGTTMVMRRFARLPRPRRSELLDATALREMFAVNRDIMIRSFVLLSAFALFARQGAQLGTLTLAVNAVLLNFFLVAGYFLDGFATAAEQLAGRAVGARQRQSFVDAVRLSSLWGFVMAGLAALAMLGFGNGIVAIMTTAQEVRAGAAVYLPWAAFTAASGVLAFQMDGVYIGATWSRDMRNMMLLSFALFVVALIALPQWWGNHGLWAALHVFLIARGLSLTAVLPGRIRRTFATP
ncbi:MATE family efflux transporter [Nitratireductor sp. StC3]|uniref:MATE family efflux transporter n=1 Tax=Nitratireductor sp. StC3 TaxID=2126741 RepID=UPI000D0E14B4|nr:MATE family efflux transporter [Nitratireductor sp. StC3]PSM17348.1 MATE family efflux transporter [Nitratireductor sp. StC3]